MPEDPRGETVAHFAQRWLAIYVATSRSGKGMKIAAQRVRDHLAPFMGERVMRSLTGADARLYRLRCESRGLAPLTVGHLLSDLRCLLNFAVDVGALERSPFPRRVMPRIQERFPPRHDDAEVEALLAIPEPHAFIVRLALGTGLRWAELCRARAEHLEGGSLKVGHTKSGRTRRIPLPPALAREIAGRTGALVSYSVTSVGDFNRYVKHHSGVPGFHVHRLRHTFSCRWIERGGSLPSLQQILGHASIVTTQMYAKMSDESVRREAAAMYGAEALAPASRVAP